MAKKFEELINKVQKKTGKSMYQIAIDLEFSDITSLKKFIQSKERAGKRAISNFSRYCRIHLKMTATQFEDALIEDSL